MGDGLADHCLDALPNKSNERDVEVKEVQAAHALVAHTRLRHLWKAKACGAHSALKPVAFQG
jgi:hypothetical protein